MIGLEPSSRGDERNGFVPNYLRISVGVLVTERLQTRLKPRRVLASCEGPRHPEQRRGASRGRFDQSGLVLLQSPPYVPCVTHVVAEVSIEDVHVELATPQVGIALRLPLQSFGVMPISRPTS